LSEISASTSPPTPPGPLGARVSIRLQIPGESGYHDLLGHLELGNIVRRKDGTTATFDPADVVAWRQVPISPTKSDSAFDIELLEKSFGDITNKNKIIITTEKDAMRLENLNLREKLKKLPLYFIPIEIAFHQKDQEDFNRYILNYVRTT